MCRRVNCSVCNKPTYAGCGMHIEQVLGDVAPADRCQGHTRAEAPKSGPQEKPRKPWWPF
ncbi:MAG: hypothetical protein JNK72_21790 [Myxococcales bacterium]|nr:hypothetical protein [Myxococcales bacterium]